MITVISENSNIFFNNVSEAKREDLQMKDIILLKNRIFCLERLENFVENGENAEYSVQAFSPFSIICSQALPSVFIKYKHDLLKGYNKGQIF